MPKQSPIPDEVDGEFWAACNREELRIQYCAVCERFQHPPQRVCSACGGGEELQWRRVDGAGEIYSYAVICDTPIAVMQRDQPFNCAVVTLDEAPGVHFLSHLPGVAVGEVEIGARVALMFEETRATGQKVPEWRVVQTAAAEVGRAGLGPRTTQGL